MSEPRSTYNGNNAPEMVTAPHNLLAEYAVLGSMMLKEEAVQIAVGLVIEDNFWKESHRQLYRVIVSMYEQNIPIDFVSISQQVRKSGASVTGLELTEINAKTPTASNVLYYIKLLQEAYILRKIYQECHRMTHEALSSSADGLELLFQYMELGYTIDQSIRTSKVYTLGEVSQDVLLELMHAEEKQNGISTGFYELDDIIGGFHGSEFIILAGRPSMGKTAFMLSLILNLGRNKIPTLVFSLEMSKEQLAKRSLSSKSSVPLTKIMRNDVNSQGLLDTLTTAHKEFNEYPVFIDESPSLSMLELSSTIKKYVQKEQVQVVFIDYLQLIKENSQQSRELQVSNISKAIKGLAKELNIPIIALAQLNREVTKRSGDKRPMLSDLRESGSLEQDADIAIFIHRPEYYEILTDESGESTENMAEIIVRKARNAKIGTVKLQYDRSTQQFSSINTPASRYPDASNTDGFEVFEGEDDDSAPF